MTLRAVSVRPAASAMAFWPSFMNRVWMCIPLPAWPAMILGAKVTSRLCL